MVNSVDPDEAARYDPSHLDLHCLHRYWFWSATKVNPSVTRVSKRGTGKQRSAPPQNAEAYLFELRFKTSLSTSCNVYCINHSAYALNRPLFP